MISLFGPSLLLLILRLALSQHFEWLIPGELKLGHAILQKFQVNFLHGDKRS